MSAGHQTRRAPSTLGVVLTMAGAVTMALVLGAPSMTIGRAEAPVGTDTAVLAKSIGFFETRLARDPWNYPVGSRLIGRYLQRFQLAADLRDLERAEVVARQLTGITPDTVGAYARLSGILLAQHRFTEALDAAQRAASIATTNQGGLAALFDAALAAGRYDLAESALRAIRPRSLERLVRDAQWLDATGETDGAFASMDRSCRTVARSARSPVALAWCLTELAGIEHVRSDSRGARRWLDSALVVQPGYRGAVEALADLDAAEGDCVSAMARYTMIATDAHPDLYLRLAECHRAIGRLGVAERYERMFLRVATARGAEPLNAPGLVLLYADRPAWQDSALALALREVARRPTVESWDLLSWVRYQRGEVTLALDAAERARAWGAPSPTMDYHRARILEATGQVVEATALRLAATRRLDLLEPHARRDHLAR